MKIFSRKNLGGFTLIEMIVVCAIVTILTGIAIFDYIKYNDHIELNGSAQKIVLALRQAQVWGTATKEFPSGSGKFNSGFGVHFDTTNPGQFIFFADAVPNGDLGQNDGKYNGNPGGTCDLSSECIEKIVLKPGYKIDGLCVSSIPSCTVGSSGQLDIVFTRPSIGDRDTGLGPIINGDKNNVYAKLQISSPKSADKKYIEVDSFGNITILPLP